MTIQLTNKEMNVLASALERNIESVELAALNDFTPDTKTMLRNMFKKHLRDARKLRSKIKFISLN